MMWYWYREREEGEICLLRIFGDCSEVVLPDWIEGKPVTQIGDYCFSDRETCTGREEWLRMAQGDSGTAFSGDPDSFRRAYESGAMVPLCGGNITRVVLPAAVRKIGQLCFYQCRNLKELSIGPGECEIGSDAFMNCRKFHKVVLRAKADQRTALRQILMQRTGEMDAWFTNAAIHFPEFSETYDLIGPAHIFELNIKGEGFRARQCFEGEVFQFERYDSIFAQARETEPEVTLCKMAAFRLRYPAGLREKFYRAYAGYLLEHIGAFCDELIRLKDLTLLEGLGEQGLLGEEQQMICVEKMLQAKWVQGTRMLLAWKKEWNQKNESGESEECR